MKINWFKAQLKEGKNKMKDKIVYVEDDRMVIYGANRLLRENFPDHEISIYRAADEALENMTPHLGNINVVCTDGNLINSTGWDLAEGLKQKGYEGPIIYIGNAKIPEGKEHLFNDRSPKGTELLIDKINQWKLE